MPDNLKTGVDRPDLYDPKLNRSYGELGAHYQTLIDPARSKKPRDKPQIERPMPYIRDSFWRGREFTSLEHMRSEALRWCAEVAGRRQCRPLDGAAPATVFEAVERAAPEDHLVAHLPTVYLLLAGVSAVGSAPVAPPSPAEVIGYLRAQHVELVYDPDGRTLRADVPAAVKVRLDRRAS